MLLLVAGAERANDWVRHTLEVRRLNAETLSDLERIASARRGFLLDRTAARAEFVETAVDQSERGFDALAKLVADNPLQTARVESMRSKAAFQIELGRGTISGERSRTRADIAAELLAGSENLRAIRAESAAFDEYEEQLLAERQRSASWLRRLLLAAAFLALLGAGLLMSFVFRRWNQHVLTLRAAAESLQEEIAFRERAELQLRQAQKMEALGQLTGGVAHDFNNMLAVIVGGLDLWLKRADPAAPRRNLVENALEAARRAGALTSRLLAFSRQQPLSPVVLDINRVTREMSELLRQSLGEQVMLETVLSGGLWPAHVDRSQLESAILNLAVNARDAMGERGGRLTIETGNTYLDEAYARLHPEVAPGQYVMIAVTDTGAGMSQDTMAKAFDPFFTTKPLGQGTGLGLSQVHGFVKQSGGHLKLYSELGVGTSVKIYLPRNTDSLVPLEELARRRATGRRAPCVVLLVEDEEGVRTFVAEALCELGCEPVKAAGGEEALALLAARTDIKLLLTDVVMPHMNGSDLVARALEMRPDLKILYMTGYTRNAIVHNGVLDAGVKLLSKPFTTDQLDDALEAALR